MDVVMGLDIRDYFTFDHLKARKIRKLVILPPIVEEPKQIVCIGCNGEGKVVETCWECDGAGWVEE